MQLKCKICNNSFSEEELYELTEEYYKKTNVEVKKLMFNKKGVPKANKDHKYICPCCRHIINSDSLRKEDDK